jgi:hypothetical protein
METCRAHNAVPGSVCTTWYFLLSECFTSRHIQHDVVLTVYTKAVFLNRRAAARYRALILEKKEFVGPKSDKC